MVIPAGIAQPASDAFGQVAVGFSDLTKSFGLYFLGVSLASRAQEFKKFRNNIKSGCCFTNYSVRKATATF